MDWVSCGEEEPACIFCNQPITNHARGCCIWVQEMKYEHLYKFSDILNSGAQNPFGYIPDDKPKDIWAAWTGIL